MVKDQEKSSEEMEASQEPIKAPEIQMSTNPGKTSGNTVAIVAILATAVLMLGCIVACAVIAFAFIQNAPW